MAIVVIPLVFEMPTVLAFWLKEVPENAVMFCRMVLIASVCDQLTIGLGTANQAIGQIRNYSLVVNTIKVLTLPAAWVCLYIGLDVASVMWCYLGVEILCALTRLPFLNITAGLHIGHFIQNVFLRLLFPIVAMTATCYAMIRWIDLPYRFILTMIISSFVGIIAIWFTALQSNEKEILKNSILNKLIKK